MINKKQVLQYYPIIATVIFEISTVGQLIRMIHEQSALGQEPISWFLVVVGLFGWSYWYKVMTPENKIPMYTALFSGIFNIIGLLTTIYFKYLI